MTTFEYRERDGDYLNIWEFDVAGYINPNHIESITIEGEEVTCVTLKNGKMIKPL